MALAGCGCSDHSAFKGLIMDVTANLASTSQMDTWMQAAVQRTLATVDEWCYALSQILGTNGCPSIDPQNFGLGTGMDSVFTCGGMLADGSNRSALPQISSTTFLNCLRNAQLAYNAGAPAPGGSTTTTGTSTTGGAGSNIVKNTVPTTGTTPVTGQGVLGLTNCAVCQQLASNPVMLLVLAVALWFLFFK
jgi:hypothetical protein